VFELFSGYLSDRSNHSNTELHGQEVWEDTVNIQKDHYVTGDPAFAVDRRGVVIYWNAAAEQTLGYSSSEAMGQKCWRLLSGQDSFGNRYCVRHCPLREMAFLHEPVHHFLTTFETASHQAQQYSISCLTVFDQPGDEMLLHICHPENEPLEAGNNQVHADVDPSTLSQREIEILELLAEKVSTKDIATRLDISIRTVRTHIQHLMYKLRVHKRCEAVEVGKHLRLI
jgi:DNA-binding CsgD family transcriptional regulator